MSINEYLDGLNEEQREAFELIGRRDAIARVVGFLGGIALVGGARVLHAAERAQAAPSQPQPGAYRQVGQFTPREVALLDDIADTILPTTAKSPGAKAARTGPFMALMVTDSYEARDQQLFRDGLKAIDDMSRRAYKVGFRQATPRQRLALVEALDRQQYEYTRRLEAFRRGGAEEERKEADKFLPDQRSENAKTAPDVNPAPAISADAPAHYFRMMKELALLGFFTSRIGMERAQRYVESPGRFDPCVPYRKGDRAWAPHA
ncbi:MAG: gluconate 2-dehydrogenase subunit 3 family protein [Gemmatimonadaceae bacterium]